MNEDIIQVPNGHEGVQEKAITPFDPNEGIEGFVRNPDHISISMDFESQISSSKDGNARRGNPERHPIQLEPPASSESEDETSLAESMSKSYLKRVKQLSQNEPFLLLCFALTAIYFIVTGI